MELNDVINVEVLNKIPNQPQVQCSTTDQLVAAIALCNKFGLYDAANVLREMTKLGSTK